MTDLVLRAARVATPAHIIEDGYVVVEGGVISHVGQGRPPLGCGPVNDLGDVLIAPGFVDLHVHGGGGAEVNCARRQDVEASVGQMARYHAAHGTTALVATTVSDSPEALRVAVEGVAAVAGRHLNGNGAGAKASSQNGALAARVLGSHLEGPWIAPARAGAQFRGALRPPSRPELEDLLKRGRGTVRLVTIAPELAGAMELIAVAHSQGVLAAIGHTDADHETAEAAFAAGARHATHLFNAMAPIHHRQPGPVTAALANERVTLEIIADGVHIHPALILLVATLAPHRLVLVTDAIGATGSAPGLHRLGPQEVLVSEGRAVLAHQEETVAGSVLTMDRAVALAVHVAGVPLVTALRASSLHPADALGEKGKGRLAPGADADLVVLGPDLALLATVVGGHAVHDPLGLLSEPLGSLPQVPAP